MRVVDRRPIFLYLSIVSFYLSSFAIAFMPLGLYTNILAAIFWFGIIIGIVFTCIAAKKRRWDNKYKHPKGRFPPYLSFFSNKPAIIFDSLLILGLVMLAITYTSHVLPRWLVWEMLFLTVFSLEMHFVFNGKTYLWLQAAPKSLKKR